MERLLGSLLGCLVGSLRMADCATDDGVWGGEGRGLGSMGQ
ncbi:unnamed protein product [Brassica oleracea]